MSLGARRATYFTLLLACMPLSGWAGTYDAWRWVAGDGVGTSVAEFWDLQVETYANVLLFALILDAVYGLHRDDGRWSWAPRGLRARVVAYAGLIALALLCAAETSLRSVLQVPLPDDIAASVALYFRRALEGVLATIGLMAFLDVVRPNGLSFGPQGKHPDPAHISRS